MESFKERKSRYYENIKEHAEFFTKINYKDDGRMRELMLDPKDDRELAIADATFQMILDLNNLTRNAQLGNIEPVDKETSFLTNILVKIIKAYADSDEEAVEACRKELEELSPVEAAKMIYDMLALFASNADEAVNYIATKSGFNLDNVVDEMIFELYLKKATDLANERKMLDAKAINTDDQKQLNQFLDFTNELHRLCENDEDYYNENRHNKRR